MWNDLGCQHIFPLGDVLVMEFGATSHFFPPRLQLVVEKKKNPNRFPPYFRNQFACDRFFGHHSDGPARPARWGIRADPRANALTLFVLQQSLGARSLPILQGTVPDRPSRNAIPSPVWLWA
jgi:hypothetical protein